jgi:hypothetical protein
MADLRRPPLRVKRVSTYDAGDVAFLKTLTRTYGPVGDLCFWGKAYVAVDDAGRSVGDFSAADLRSFDRDGLAGKRMLYEHRYSVNTAFPREPPPVREGGCGADAKPIGVVEHSVVRDGRELWIRGRILSENLTQEELAEVRSRLRNGEIGDLSVSYFVCQVEDTGTGYIKDTCMLGITEISLCREGAIPGTRLVSVCASMDHDTHQKAAAATAAATDQGAAAQADPAAATAAVPMETDDSPGDGTRKADGGATATAVTVATKPMPPPVAATPASPGAPSDKQPESDADVLRRRTVEMQLLSAQNAELQRVLQQATALMQHQKQQQIQAQAHAPVPASAPAQPQPGRGGGSDTGPSADCDARATAADSALLRKLAAVEQRVDGLEADKTRGERDQMALRVKRVQELAATHDIQPASLGLSADPSEEALIAVEAIMTTMGTKKAASEDDERRKREEMAAGNRSLAGSVLGTAKRGPTAPAAPAAQNDPKRPRPPPSVDDRFRAGQGLDALQPRPREEGSGSKLVASLERSLAQFPLSWFQYEPVRALLASSAQ